MFSLLGDPGHLCHLFNRGPTTLPQQDTGVVSGVIDESITPCTTGSLGGAWLDQNWQSRQYHCKYNQKFTYIGCSFGRWQECFQEEYIVFLLQLIGLLTSLRKWLLHLAYSKLKIAKMHLILTNTEKQMLANLFQILFT